MDRVLIDTTVLCAALLTRGVNYKLLELAQIPTLFEPVITETKQPVSQFLYHLFQLRTGQRKEELLTALANEEKRLEDIDPCDIHVMFGALEHDCNILLTANVDDFPKTFGNVEVVRPRAYYEYLTAKI